MIDSSPRERLLELIEAYAVAKTSQNNVLVSLSASALTQMLDAVLTPPIASDGFEVPEEKPTRTRRTN
jgi:uncharacterized lipoprotein YajG